MGLLGTAKLPEGSRAQISVLGGFSVVQMSAQQQGVPTHHSISALLFLQMTPNCVEVRSA